LIYEFECQKCSHQFEVMCTMAERELVHQCPECKSKKTERIFLTAPALGDSTKLFFRKKTPEGFKEVLRNIKKKNYKSTIDV
jgi:putative FmdB family regulatory protein